MQFGKCGDRLESLAIGGRDGLGEAAEYGNRLRLHLFRLGVLQRHIEKYLLNRCQPLVLLRHRTLDTELQCRFIQGESIRRAAIDIAAELIKDNDQRQTAAWLPGPVIEPACRGFLDVVGKFFLDLVIEHRVFAEPHIHAPVDLRRRERLLPEPEGQDRVDACRIFVCDGCFCLLAQKFCRHITYSCANRSSCNLTM